MWMYARVISRETNLPKNQCAPVAAIEGQKRPQTQSQSFSLEIRHECKGGLISECILNFHIGFKL